MEEIKNDNKKHSIVVAAISLLGVVITAMTSFFGVVFTAFLKSKGIF